MKTSLYQKLRQVKNQMHLEEWKKLARDFFIGLLESNDLHPESFP
jgi:hypothetical protein